MLYFVGEQRYSNRKAKMSTGTFSEEEPYFGLLGLDRLSPVLKTINFSISTIVGIYLAFHSWSPHFFQYMPSYTDPLFLIFILGWPLCGILIWLRLTGIRWFWCLMAGCVVS